jgi:hypothetical protein
MSKSVHAVAGPNAQKLAKDVNAVLGAEKARMVTEGSVYM